MKPAQLNREIDDNLIDDDDLQMALARQRRQATKRPKVRPEDIAERGEYSDMLLDRFADTPSVMASHQAEEEDAPADEEAAITFDDTSEFVRNVTLDALQVKREPRETRTASISGTATVVKQEPEESKPVVVKIETADEPLGGYDVEMADGEVEDDEDEALAEMALRQGLSLEEMRIKMDAELRESENVKQEDEEVSAFVRWGDPGSYLVQFITKPEPTVSGGVGGVLAMLRQQGALSSLSVQDAERERIQKEKDLWLADHRRRMAKRELEKIKARGGPQKDQAQREWENKMREQQEAREALDAYKSYKPDVNIAYTDEFGRGKLARTSGCSC